MNFFGIVKSLLSLLSGKFEGAVAPVRFAGRDLFKPGYYGQRDISKLNVGAASGSNMIIIGECERGIPYNATADFPNAEERINYVTNTTELREIIKRGEAFDGALFALAPSNQPGVNGAPVVGIIRVNQATRATLALEDVDTDDVLDIYSEGYGSVFNQIQIQVAAGTTQGKKITLKFEGETFETDNIGQDIFSVQYTGAGSAAAMTIDPAGNLVVTVTGGPGGEDISFDLSGTFQTADSLVEAFNAHASGAYTATLLGAPNFQSSLLDKVVGGDSVDIATAYTVKADLKSAQDFFTLNELVGADLSSGAERRPLANTVGFVFLTGASNGGAVNQADWQGGLDLAKLVDASFVNTVTSDAAVHAALSAHVTEMSSIDGKNERQGGAGSGNLDSKSTKIAAAKAINNQLMGFFASELKRFDEFGEEKTYAGYIGMCSISGMSAGNGITFAPTNKQLNTLGVQTKLGLQDEVDFIKAGCIVANPSELGGIRVVRSVTTFQGSNLIANEWSMTRTILFVVKDHRAFVEGLVGEPGDATGLESVKNRAEGRLDFYEEQKYFVVDPEFGNSFRNFTFKVVGDTVQIAYEATVVSPINFILVTHNFTVIGFRG